MGFLDDLAVGGFAEDFLGKILRNAGIPTSKSDAGLSSDLICNIDGMDFTVEVKYDRMEAQTGNIAVEYYNSRKCKPSGITSTTSDLWCFVLSKPMAAYITPVARLRAYMKDNKCKRDISNGGDGNAAIKLYPRDNILSIFTRIDTIPTTEVVNIVRKILEMKPNGN